MTHRMPTATGTSTSPRQIPLLATKLYFPPPRPGLVARQRLLAQLDAALRGPLTLLAAPAGWGKTSLLSAWYAAAAARDHDTSSEPVAWVSLDAGDNDPVRFWTYILTALDTAHPGVAEEALARLRSPQPPPIELILTLLLNKLAALETDTFLVLDDYHSIHVEAVHSSVDFLLDHLPPRCHLVLAAREDPPLPLARRRAQGAVIELRAADLRFTPEEIAEFLTATLGTPLSDDVVRTLEARSEGWIAGLQLAALSLRGQSRQQAEAFIATFAGSNRFIVDYLVEEVLARQPPEIQTFLLRTAVVDRFCAPLCEALLAHPEVVVSATAVAAGTASVARAPDAASPTLRALHALLEQVERTNLFLIPLDDERHWYRYHHLFAEVLRGRLHQQDPMLAAELHRRASGWFERQGLVVEAIQQALAAPDVTRAAELVEQHGLGFGLAGQVETVLGWIRALPEAVVCSRPLLCACHAHLLFISGQAEAAMAARLRDLEAAVAARHQAATQAGADEAALRPLLGILATVQALVAIPPGDLGRSVPLAHEAFFELLPETESVWRLSALTLLQQAFEVTGEVTHASIAEWSRRAVSLRNQGQLNSAMALALDVAHRKRLHGQLRAATAAYEEMMTVVPAPLQLEDLHMGAGIVFGLAQVRLEGNDLDSADQLLSRGMRMLERRVGTARTVTPGYLTLARLQQARGKYAAALATLDDFEALAERRHFAAVWSARAAAVRAQIQLAQGNLAAATHWAEASGLSADDTELEFLREREYLTLARVRIAQGQSQGRGDPAGPYLSDALRLLDLVQHDAEPKERLSSVLEVLILRALAHQVHRDLRGALGTLARALTLAAPEGYVRLFADEGAPMATLLTDLIKAVEQRRLNLSAAVVDYARGLVAACRSQDGRVPAPVSQVAPPPQQTMEGNAGEPQYRSLDLAPGVPPLLDPLTERELEVLRLLADGASNAAIAAALVVAVGTVKKHVYNICAKLGTQNRTQAVARARTLHLL
ncbi:MAG TPA: LuxR C-terminal-related transcriptional regulator [Ktedonobacterales bacterium]|jgi:LuxR family maltose regulon positive regulatory protein